MATKIASGISGCWKVAVVKDVTQSSCQLPARRRGTPNFLQLPSFRDNPPSPGLICYCAYAKDPGAKMETISRISTMLETGNVTPSTVARQLSSASGQID